MSRIWTQSVPAVVRPVSWGVGPATTVADAPARGVQPASPARPIAIPSTTLGGGLAAVSVTSVVPGCETGKLWNTVPPTCTVPANVSVVRVVVGLLTVPLVESLPHAPAASAHAIATT